MVREIEYVNWHVLGDMFPSWNWEVIAPPWLFKLSVGSVCKGFGCKDAEVIASDVHVSEFFLCFKRPKVNSVI